MEGFCTARKNYIHGIFSSSVVYMALYGNLKTKNRSQSLYSGKHSINISSHAGLKLKLKVYELTMVNNCLLIHYKTRCAKIKHFKQENKPSQLTIIIIY